MNDRLKLTASTLDTAHSAIQTARSDFAQAGTVSDGVAAAAGHPYLHDQLHSFASNWRITREKLMKSMDALASQMQGVIDGFTDVDDKLADGIRGDGSTASAEEQPALPPVGALPAPIASGDPSGYGSDPGTGGGTGGGGGVPGFAPGGPPQDGRDYTDGYQDGYSDGADEDDEGDAAQLEPLPPGLIMPIDGPVPTNPDGSPIESPVATPVDGDTGAGDTGAGAGAVIGGAVVIGGAAGALGGPRHPNTTRVPSGGGSGGSGWSGSIGGSGGGSGAGLPPLPDASGLGDPLLGPGRGLEGPHVLGEPGPVSPRGPLRGEVGGDVLAPLTDEDDEKGASSGGSAMSPMPIMGGMAALSASAGGAQAMRGDSDDKASDEERVRNARQALEEMRRARADSKGTDR